MGIEKESLRQGRIGRNEYGPDIPVVQDFPPAFAKLGYGLNTLLEEVVSIEIGAAVGEYAVLWTEFPDHIASPVVVSEKAFGLGMSLKEGDCFLREERGFTSGLVAGEIGPSQQGEQRHQQDDCRLEKCRDP